MAGRYRHESNPSQALGPTEVLNREKRQCDARYSGTDSKLLKTVMIVARSHLQRRGLHPDSSEMKLVDRAGEVVPIR